MKKTKTKNPEQNEGVLENSCQKSGYQLCQTKIKDLTICKLTSIYKR